MRMKTEMIMGRSRKCSLFFFCSFPFFRSNVEIEMNYNNESVNHTVFNEISQNFNFCLQRDKRKMCSLKVKQRAIVNELANDIETRKKNLSIELSN